MLLLRAISRTPAPARRFGKIIDLHQSPNGEKGYSIEVFNALGETIAITALPESALEPLHRDSVLSVRQLAPA